MLHDKHHRGWKYCAFGLTLLAVFLLQNTRAVFPQVLGSHLDLIPFLIAAVALFEGPYVAGCMGFAAGLLLALSVPSFDGILAVYYGCVGTLVGAYGAGYMRPVLPSCLLLGFVIAFFREFVAYIFYYGLFYKINIVPYGLTFFISIALSIVPAIITYFWIRKLTCHFMENNENER